MGTERKTIDRARRALLVAAAALLAVPAATTPATAQPRDELRVGVWDLPPSRGNPFGGRSVPSTFVWDAVYDPLVRIDESGAPVPVLATEWRVTDPTTWIFRLRPGVAFSNGTPMNADAVVATLEFLTTQAGRATPVGSELTNLAGVRKVDDLTVEVKTTGPDPVLPNRLTLVSIVEPNLWRSGGAEGYAANPIGTGPYKVDSWGAGQVALSANPNAWRKPQLPKLRVLELPERPARLQALQSGQIDVAMGLSPDNMPAMRAANLQVVSTPAPQVMSIAFVTEGRDNSPFKDVRVRQALNYAVNKDVMAKELLAGLVRGTAQGATSAAFGYHPSLPAYPYDPERAKRLLREAGFPNGFTLVAEVTVDAFPADSEVYQQMAMDLDAVGVKTELRQIRFPEWLRKFTSNGWEGLAFGSSWNAAPYMDSIRPYTYMSCMKRPAHYCDPEVMPLIEASNAEFDREKRKAILLKLHEMTRDRPPALFLVEQVDVTGVSARVQGFRYTNRIVQYEAVTLR